MRLSELISNLPIQVAPTPLRSSAPDPASVRITDITEDSRTVLPGSLFVARRGEKSDGRLFIAAALKAGASAILSESPAADTAATSAVALTTDNLALVSAQLAERFYGNASSQLTLIGITGTNGKTTTAYLAHQLLNRAARRTGLIGTVCIDDGREIAAAMLTTPPAMELSRTFAIMVESGCIAAVMETSSHALHQHRTGGLAFKVAVFTNLTHDHLDYHGTMEHYAAAKAMLFERLAPDATAIVNADDPAAPRMLLNCPAQVLRCRVFRAGAPQLPADASATITRISASGMSLSLRGPWGEFDVLLPLIGTYNAMNALQATTAAFVAGVSLEDLHTGLARAVAPPGRLQPVTAAHSPIAVYVDYAHTDDALARVLAVGRDVLIEGAQGTSAPPARLHAVFGCGGDRDATKRPKMGRIAATMADRITITSDNPRTERQVAIIDAILAGVPAADRSKVFVQPDRDLAIRHAIAQMTDGDLLIIAGKGHEDYQILPDPDRPGQTIKRDFDDRLVAQGALADRDIATPPLPTGPAKLLGFELPARPAAARIISRSGALHAKGPS